MAKKVLTLIKLQIPGGQANPAPPVGPALGQHGVNIMEFCKAYNAQTAHENGRIIPVEITVFEDRSFTFITKTPPAAVLIKEALGHRLRVGRAEPPEGRSPHERTAALHRGGEDARPQRARRRRGDEGDRRHSAEHGSRDAMSTHGKRYRAAREAIDREQAYTPLEAVRLLKETPPAKFDETVEAHFRLGLNVRHADEQLRGTIMLPHGIGKDVRVAVFAEGEKAREAEDAGADIVGSADLATQIEGGFLDFDVAIATPDQMSVVGKLGRVLGPRGLMPNPKTGTVTMDVQKAVSDAKAGKLEYRTGPRRQRAPPDRQAELRRACAARELRGPRGGDRPREAVGGEGSVHQADHPHDDDGPRDPRRLDHHPGHRRGAGGSYSLGLATSDSRRRPSAALTSVGPAEAGSVSASRVSTEPACARVSSFRRT